MGEKRIKYRNQLGQQIIECHPCSIIQRCHAITVPSFHNIGSGVIVCFAKLANTSSCNQPPLEFNIMIRATEINNIDQNSVDAQYSGESSNALLNLPYGFISFLIICQSIILSHLQDFLQECDQRSHYHKYERGRRCSQHNADNKVILVI